MYTMFTELIQKNKIELNYIHQASNVNQSIDIIIVVPYS